MRERGVSVIVVEQDITRSLAVADRFYCFLEGEVSLSGRPGRRRPRDDHATLFRGLSAMVETILNLLVQGVLIGGLYALFALGLSLSLGVMRFVNIAHGDMIVLFSFVILSLTGALGWSPFLAALILIPVAFGAGYVLQRFLLQRTVGKGILPILLVTFGLSIIIQNGLLEAYGPNTRKLSGGAVELAAFQVGPIAIGVYPLLVFLLAVALIAGLDAFLYRTAIGRAHPRGQRRSRQPPT